MRLESRKVDLDDLVEVAIGIREYIGIRSEQLLVRRRDVGELAPLCRLQVDRHTLVVGKDRGRRAQLGTHIRDRALARARERGHARSKILDDPIRTALDGQQITYLQDHVLGRGPSRELPGQMDTDETSDTGLPREVLP